MEPSSQDQRAAAGCDDAVADQDRAVIEVAIPNPQGMHARPVMRFVDLASAFHCDVRVSNATGRNEEVDGKSAMEMMLLEAVQGSVLRIKTSGPDADKAAEALAALVKDAFGMDGAV